MDKDRVIIFDTTLRDAEQTPGASLTVPDKLEIARQLARLKVDVIEAGFPISSNEDFEAVHRIGQEVEGPVICGLARVVLKDIDRVGEALEGADSPRIHTFVGTSDIHLAGQLRKGKSEVLEMAVAAVKHARSYCDDVEFEGTGGATVTVSMDSWDFDTYLYLLDQDCHVLVENDDRDGQTSNSGISVQLPADGAYSMVFTSKHPISGPAAATGSFDWELDCAP